jgi:hypothetical protein
VLRMRSRMKWVKASSRPQPHHGYPGQTPLGSSKHFAGHNVAGFHKARSLVCGVTSDNILLGPKYRGWIHKKQTSAVSWSITYSDEKCEGDIILTLAFFKTNTTLQNLRCLQVPLLSAEIRALRWLCQTSINRPEELVINVLQHWSVGVGSFTTVFFHSHNGELRQRV